MFELIDKGGPTMWLILACSFVAVVIFFERLFNLHRAQIKADDFLKGIYNVLRQRNYVEAVSLCDETPGPVAHMCRSAILHHDEDPERIRRSIEETGLVEIPRLEKNLGLLATISKLAPLIGLLGTVLGMMRVLLTAQQKAPLIQSGDLMAGLWQALICTAAGLLVAILTYAGYNLLVMRVESIVLDMEKSSGDIMSFLAGLQRRESMGSE
ncbi:MAG TPA: biopolymer transporter ExbB [Verrucomicrobia bacterium]|nr:MAG: biopolymer transporter ExbB [Lentisphaerae bacterium GWF2_57_35]HBA83298.1 biopolymer transporter ExbB [Verrucomicrobiota bacterium]